MKKRRGVALATLITTFSVLFIGCSGNSNSTNSFADLTMGKVIANAAGVEDFNKVTQDDLDSVTYIEIGLPCYYETLIDLKKCKNLETLVISYNDPMGTSLGMTHDYYDVAYDESKVVVESKERVEEIQNQLKEIIDSCENLKSLYFYTYEIDEERQTVFAEDGSVKQYLPLTSLSFMDDRNLEAVDICYQTEIKDIEKVYDNTNLRVLSVSGSGLGNLERLSELGNLEILRVDPSYKDVDFSSYTKAEIKGLE